MDFLLWTGPTISCLNADKSLQAPAWLLADDKRRPTTILIIKIEVLMGVCCKHSVQRPACSPTPRQSMPAAQILWLDHLLPPLLIDHFQGTVRALRLQDNICRVSFPHQSEP